MDELTKQPEIIPAGSFALQPLEFTEEQKTLIKRMCQAEGLDDNEFQIFLHICQRRRLDPILRQIYATKRNKKIKEGNVEKWVKILVPIVAIEGMTATAERSKTYAPSEKKPEFEFAKAGDKLPLACTVWMKKFSQGQWHEFPFTGYFAEFAQDTDTWRKMPFHMLMKCCRAGALRMGWPEDCGGLYIEEEWAPEASGEFIEAPKRKERERASISKMKESKEENRGHGNEGMDEEKRKNDHRVKVLEELHPGSTKMFDQYTTSVKNAILKSNVTKEWLEVKVEGGKASVWNDLSQAFKDEPIPLTTLYCWHQSLFEALLFKPQKVVLSISSKEGSRFSPIIEDILAIDEVKYEKGKPYVAPEVAVMPKVEPEWKKCSQCQRENSIETWTKNNNKCPNCNDLFDKETKPIPEPQAATKQSMRTESVLRLSNAFETIWPASNIAVRSLRNNAGKMMLNLQSKEQLNDLSYPQDNINAAISALERYNKLQPKPEKEAGILNQIDNYFKEELAQIQAQQADLGF